MARKSVLSRWLCMAYLCCSVACSGTEKMEPTSDSRLTEQLTSDDHRVCDQAALNIVHSGEPMIEPLLKLEGNKQPYAGALGNPRGSMVTLMPLPNFPLSPEQQEKVVTVEAAALYLLEAIYHGRLDFASSALLCDLDTLPDERKAANKAEYLSRGFDSAREWAASVKKEGLASVKTRGENPLKRARLAFW